MHPATYVALLAGTASAQSTVTVLNMLMFQSTLTRIGADSTATTYKNDCPANNAGITVIPEPMRPKPDDPTPAASRRPTTTPKARLARQVPISAVSTVEGISSDPSEPYYSLCEPFTIKQGPSTWEYHMKDPAPGAWTMDANCKWKGDITAADLTCTMDQSGYVTRRLGAENNRIVTTIPQREAATDGSFNVVTVVSGSASQRPSVTSAPSQGASGATASNISPSGSAAGSAGSTGATSKALAAAAPLPTGAVALFGGAAGILAAAIAL